MVQPADRLLIGRDIPWRMIEAETLRVSGFTAFSTVDANNSVSGPPIPMPYALLDVESTILNRPASMPVNHRIDFLNLWDIDRQRAVPNGYHLLVSYLPYRGLLGPLIRLGSPVLHLWIMSESKAQAWFAQLSADPRERHKSSRRLLRLPERCVGCSTKLYSFMTRCTKCNTSLHHMA